MSPRQYTIEAEQSPSEVVVRAVANREGVSTTAVDPPLYETVDPDALDGLFRTRTDGDSPLVTVQFHYAEYLISIFQDDETHVQVSERSGLAGGGASAGDP